MVNFRALSERAGYILIGSALLYFSSSTTFSTDNKEAAGRIEKGVQVIFASPLMTGLMPTGVYGPTASFRPALRPLVPVQGLHGGGCFPLMVKL